MLPIFESEKLEIQRNLKKRIAAEQHSGGEGFRYTPELRSDVCCFVRTYGVSPYKASQLLGVSQPTILAWLKAESAFRAIAVVDVAPSLPVEAGEQAEVRLGNGVVIQMPASALCGELLTMLARL